MLNNFLKSLNINPKDINLYEEAFTHLSYTKEKKLKYSYERLEFFGDALIELIVSEFLYSRYKYFSPQQLSNSRKLIIQSSTEIMAAKELKMGEYIKIGKSLNNTIPDKLYEDCFEALCGAIYLDQGMEKLKDFLRKTIIKYYEKHSLDNMKDYKEILYKKYNQNDVKFDNVKTKTGYKSTLFINNKNVGTGEGRKYKNAENNAAKFFLATINIK